MTRNPFFDEALASLRAGGYRGSAWRRLLATLRARAAQTASGRPGLVREVRVAEAAGAVGAAAIGLSLWRADGVSLAAGLLVPPLAWLLLCEWVRVELGLIRHPLTDREGPAVGLANWMTIYRGWVAAPAALIAVASPRPTAAWAGLCISAGITDLVDGTVARLQGNESRLGRLLDPVLDACFFTAAAASLAGWGLVPWWLAALVAVRYFGPVIGGLVVMLARGRTLPVRHTPWGQRATLAIGVALLAGWLAGLVRLPAWIVPTLYAVAIATMALALAGIVRRLPPAGG